MRRIETVFVMIDVLVQVWGPVEGTFSYSWITVAKIADPESLDIDYLKAETAKRITAARHPHADVVRLVVVKDGITEMKIMINDIFRSAGEKEVK